MSSQLQNLSNQFNSLITQYTDTYQNYISVINLDDNSLTTVPNSSFVGESNISIENQSTINNCQNSCTSNKSCSGATFNNNSNSCTLSSGNGNIVSTSQSTAIVHQVLYYSYQLQNINSQLMDINQQMMNVTNNNYSEFQETQQQNQEKAQVLQSNYQTLTQEREQIDHMIRQFQTINAAYENGNINVTSNYYSYIILIFVAMFLVFILIKLSVSGQQSGGGPEASFSKNHLLIFGFLGFVIVFNSMIKK
jgi:hypothetical protein